jgi:hypothetical protein
VTIGKGKKIRAFIPLTPSNRPKGENKIERRENMDSQPWTQIVGWHPGQSAFVDEGTQESQFRPPSTGAEPLP